MRIYLPIDTDASIYEEFPTLQTGIDEILEIGKNVRGNQRVRSLVKFHLASLSQLIQQYAPSASVYHDLTLYNAFAERVTRPQLIEAYPVSESWDAGQGYFYQDVFDDPLGATWRNRNASNAWQTSGSSFITSISSSATFSPNKKDLTFDITELTQYAFSNSMDYHGILLKYPTLDEDTIDNVGILKFFSSNTHTIYAPQLVSKFDDRVFSPVSSSLQTGSFTIVPTNLETYYDRSEIVRVNLYPKSTMYIKTFARVANPSPKLHFSNTSTFSIVDIASNTTIIPDDEFSPVSTDANGSYIVFSTECLRPQRWYAIYIHTENTKTKVSETFTIRA